MEEDQAAQVFGVQPGFEIVVIHEGYGDGMGESTEGLPTAAEGDKGEGQGGGSGA